MKIKSIRKVTLESPKPFYDITVEKYSNFSIGKSKIISHNSSLSGAISKLARPFGCSYQILEGDGFFGSPVNPSPSAPRYTSVRINKDIKNTVFKHYDLNEKNEEGGHDWLYLEVPIGLLTHIVGIAVGYRSNILPRKLEDIVEYLEGKNKLMKPYFRDFNGKIYKIGNDDNLWLLESGFEINEKKKTIHIFDLPPVMRYDSFMIKLIQKLDLLGIEYRIQNNSQSKCEIFINFTRSVENEWERVCGMVKKLTQIIVKEDVVFIKDGAVVQLESVKEYLDMFKIHIEEVKLKRLKTDETNYKLDLEFLEAKLQFLIFMSQKKRTNQEIIEFLSKFVGWISNKLSGIQIVKLSADHIKETEEEIKQIKQKIKTTQAQVKKQQEILVAVTKVYRKNKPSTLMVSTKKEIPLMPDVEIFEIEEEEEVDLNEEDRNIRDHKE
jgi:DNA gyrase/topoisomerase IV subunit A